MTENSPPDVGRAAIDEYLDSVEQALVAAHAPRSDRLQVLQDLESQIADMLAREPLPLTEESVRSVIDRLEPPRHFADIYGNATEFTSPLIARFMPLPQISWQLISAVSCALLAMGCLLALLAMPMEFRGPLTALTILFLLSVGLVFTPVAIWNAFKQLRAQPGKVPGRDLVLKSTVAYGMLAPILIVLFAAALTEGYAFFLLGIAALVYVQYVLVRRLWRYMAEALPPQPASASTAETNENGASSPISSATPMPAM